MEENNLIGRKIVNIRPMTKAEIKEEYWDDRCGHCGPIMIELDDGTLIYPSRDSEGNGPGEFFLKKGKETHMLCAKEVK